MGYYTRFECQTETTEEQELKLAEIVGESYEPMLDGGRRIGVYHYKVDV